MNTCSGALAISEVAADWCELMIPQRIMRLANSWTRCAACRRTTAPIIYTRPSPRSSAEIGDRSRVYRLGIQPSHPGSLSLAIPPWVGVMSTDNGYGHRWGRNGKFCVTVGPLTRTVGTLTQSVKGAGC